AVVCIIDIDLHLWMRLLDLAHILHRNTVILLAEMADGRADRAFINELDDRTAIIAGRRIQPLRAAACHPGHRAAIAIASDEHFLAPVSAQPVDAHLYIENRVLIAVVGAQLDPKS